MRPGAGRDKCNGLSRCFSVRRLMPASSWRRRPWRGPGAKNCRDLDHRAPTGPPTRSRRAPPSPRRSTRTAPATTGRLRHRSRLGPAGGPGAGRERRGPGRAGRLRAGRRSAPGPDPAAGGAERDPGGGPVRRLLRGPRRPRALRRRRRARRHRHRAQGPPRPAAPRRQRHQDLHRRRRPPAVREGPGGPGPAGRRLRARAAARRARPQGDRTHAPQPHQRYPGLPRRRLPPFRRGPRRAWTSTGTARSSLPS